MLLTLKTIHPLLKQHLATLPDSFTQNETLQNFIETVNEAYQKFDRDRESIQHSHRLSDLEYVEINKKLNESTDRLSLATKAAKMGVWEWSGVTGNIIWDDLMYEIFGVTDREAFGKISTNWFKLTHPEDVPKISKKLAHINTEEPTMHFEFRIIRPTDNSLRYISASTFLSVDPKKQPIRIVGICMDVTELRLAEKEKAELLENVLKQNRELEDFAFVISHRLRSHSSKLSTVAHVFKNPSANESLQKELIKEVEKEAHLLDETLKELTEIIGINDNKSTDIETLNLQTIIESAISNLQTAIENCNATVEVSIDSSIQVYAVKSYLQNICFQLLDNALKFRTKKKQLVIRIVAEENDENVKLSITDNGIGIDLERHQNKLFGIYRKFHTHIEGKGIGLHLAKKQLELMGGKIEVQSMLNEGTQFNVYLKKA